MGGGTFDASAYRSFSDSTKTKRTEEIYRSRSIHKDLDPKGIKFRESRDSADNPASTPLIVALDVTGSMGMLADTMAREGLGTLFTSVLDRKPISNPHVMFMAVGDAGYDAAPLQVSQFEADNRIVDQLTNIWLEKGGGNNPYESYDLPWYFAGFHTVHDSFEKRAKRGYLFTVGDEEAPRGTTREELRRVIGDETQANMSPLDMLTVAQRYYDVFHIIVEEGNHARRYLDRVVSSWADLLGQRVIRLPNHKLLSETIVSAIEVAEGRDAADSAKGWGSGGGIVHAAVKNLPRGAGNPRLGLSK